MDYRIGCLRPPRMARMVAEALTAAKTPYSAHPQESFSLSDPLISKPSAPLIDDDDDSLFFPADARSGGPAARPSAAAASSIFKPPPPPAPRFDAAAHAPAACPVAGGAAAGAASSFHQAMAQPAPATDRVPDEMTDQ